MSKSTPRMVASSAAFCASTPAHTPRSSSNPNGGETPIAQNRTPSRLIRSMVGEDTSQASLTTSSTSVGIAGGWNLPVAAFPEAAASPPLSPPHAASAAVKIASALSTTTRRAPLHPRPWRRASEVVIIHLSIRYPPHRAREMRRGLTGRMVVASGLLALIVGGAFAVVLVTITELRGTTDLRRQTREELVAADTLEKHVIDLETGLRGYIITRDESFLEPSN